MRQLLALAAALTVALALNAQSVFAELDLEWPDADTIAIADEVQVDPLQLQGAINTTRLDARPYLIAVGLLPAPAGPNVSRFDVSRPAGLRAYAYAEHPDVAWCIERIVQVESNGWVTYGWNPIPWGRWGEHASGLGGFLPSTWRTTPQGRAGASIWDGQAQVDAIAWMLHAGRGREFAAVAWGRCR